MPEYLPVALGCALAGHGERAARLLHRGRRLSSGEHAALGMAVTAVLGGFANLLGVALAPTLWLVGGAGLLLCATALPGLWRARPSTADLMRGLVCLSPALLLAGVHAVGAVPVAVLQAEDDFHNYLVRPLRVLATGSVAGGSFDSLGADTLGAHAWFQAFVLLTGAEVDWLPAFDAVFCLLLSGLLLEALGRQVAAGWPWRLGAALVLVTVPPLVINQSAAYAGTAMALATLVGGLRVCAALGEPEAAAATRAASATGLLAATLAGLKLTFLPWAALFCLALPLLAGRRRGRLLAALLAGAALGLAPWLLLLALEVMPHWPAAGLATAGGELGPLGGLPSVLRVVEIPWGGHLLDWYGIYGLALLPLLLAARRDGGAVVALGGGALLLYELQAADGD